MANAGAADVKSVVVLTSSNDSALNSVCFRNWCDGMALARRECLEELQRAEKQKAAKASLRPSVLHMSSSNDSALKSVCFRSWCDSVALARRDRPEELRRAEQHQSRASL